MPGHPIADGKREKLISQVQLRPWTQRGLKFRLKTLEFFSSKGRIAYVPGHLRQSSKNAQLYRTTFVLHCTSCFIKRIGLLNLFFILFCWLNFCAPNSDQWPGEKEQVFANFFFSYISLTASLAGYFGAKQACTMQHLGSPRRRRPKRPKRLKTI